jgi:trk system potassium uptake protein TrkA
MMKKQAIVIGLGQFGTALVRTLAQRGVEVVAVDENEEKVRLASTVATHAVCFDATDEVALGRLGPDRRDLAVVSIGDEAREASIICTALLRQMGAPFVVARATDTIHERILRLVGAHEVVNPERAFGERVATRILYRSVIDEAPLGEDLVITELRPPPVFVGRTLAELALPRLHGVTVVGTKREDSGLTAPSPNQALNSDDILVVVAAPGAVARMMERVER